MRRVAITGIGSINALGHDAPSSWRAMRGGRVGIGPIANIATDLLQVKIAAEVHGFDPAAHFEPRRLTLLDRVSQFALVAAREAIAQSGLDFRSECLGERAACIIGTGIGGENTHDETAKRFYGDRKANLHPLTIVRLMANAPACQVTMEFGITGPSFAVVSACASANHAMAQAFDMVRQGRVDFAVTGGAEACLTVPVVKAWEAVRVTADDTCRPFCRQRRGMVLGEGAGIVVLEEWGHAKARGADILAEFAGAGMSADAGDIVLPSVEGAARAIAGALADARMDAGEVGYINAHGTGTRANDLTETAAIRKVFGANAGALAVSSTKSMHGHALGAAGAIELLAVIGALREGVIAPTANFIDADPACDLDCVPNVAREKIVRAALSNSFAFGGLNAVVALRQA